MYSRETEASKMQDTKKLPTVSSHEDEESQQTSRDLLQTITLSYQTLIDTFRREGHFQIEYPKSRDGWWRTLFIWEGRSLDLIASPFFLSVLHAVGYCIVHELVMDLARHELEVWEVFFPLVLSTTLSLLLVFRLNRAADRWWTSRIKWGQIIAITRNLVSGLVIHAEHHQDARDRTIQWILTFVIATMERLRDVKVPPKENFAGVLCERQFKEMVGVDHPPMYAADQARYFLAQVFKIDADTPIVMANRKTQHLNKMETMIDELMLCCGAMERIKATPLPIVYVSHLRTFLLLSLLMIPYAWGPSWGWATIPFVAVTSFAWLGIEAASMDAEYPFSPVRRNALDMDSYCLLVIQGTMQQLQQHAKRNGTVSKEQYKV
jgi:putative membrane protein